MKNETHWVLQRCFLFESGDQTVINLQVYDDKAAAIIGRRRMLAELEDLFAGGVEEMLGQLGLKGVAYAVAELPFLRSSGLVVVGASGPGAPVG